MSQTINVDITPNNFQPTLNYSQGDVGRTFSIKIVSQFGDTLPSGATVKIQATKPSGFGFDVTADSVTDNVATFTTTAEMTDEWGRFPAQLDVTKDAVTIFSAKFLMVGAKNTHPEGTTDGSQGTIIPELTLLVERVEAAASSVLDMEVEAQTLPAGSLATYSYDEDENKATFGIPQGEAGAGAVGVTASAYSASKTYAVGDYAIHNSNLYRCTTAITTAEAFTAAHWTQVVLGDDVTDLKGTLTYNYIPSTTGTNLFDKNHSKNICAGCYFAYSTGTKVESATYTAFIVPINADMEYLSLNSAYAHIAFVSDYVDLSAVSPNTVVDGYISGVVSGASGAEGFSIPSTAKYVIVSVSNTQIGVAQLQYGESCTAYEAFEHIFNVNTVKDNSLPISKIKDFEESLDGKLVSYIAGTNLFDKNNSDNLCVGYYVSYSTGKKVANASYTMFIVPIDANERYLSINSIYAQIVFTSEYVNLTEASADEVVNGFISGVVGDNSALEGVSIPNSAKYAIVSISSVQVSVAQLQYGTECTTYEPYEEVIDGRKIKKGSVSPDAIANGYATSYIVDVNGSGDYTSLRTCLDYIRTNNLSDVNVYILEGTYDIEADYTTAEKEAESFIGLIVPRNVALIGIGNKEDIVLTYTASEPTTAVSTLNLIENVSIKNLTIKGENVRYCVHDDYALADTSHANGNKRDIENVDFIGNNLTFNIAYGAGTRGNAEWIFNRCRFINKTGSYGFSTHDAVVAVSDSDYYEFNECEFIGKGQNSVRLCPATSGFDSDVVFNGCIMQGIHINSQFTGGNDATTVFNILGGGNTKDLHLAYYCDHDKLSFPRFPEICKSAINASSGALAIGDYVKFSNGAVVAGTAGDNDGVMFNACNDGEVAYVNIY